MTNAETVKLIGLLVVAYPNYDKFRDEAHVRSTVALWDQCFAEDDFKLVQLALEKHIATSKWPPGIAEIREIMADISLPGLLPVDEAWMAVKKLMAVHERLYGATSDYLPAPIAQAVDTVGYQELMELGRSAALGHNKRVGLDRVAFAQAYEAIRERERARAALPKKLQGRLAAARQYYADGSERQIQRLETRYQEYQEALTGRQSTLQPLAQVREGLHLMEGDSQNEAV